MSYNEEYELMRTLATQRLARERRNRKEAELAAEAKRLNDEARKAREAEFEKQRAEQEQRREREQAAWRAEEEKKIRAILRASFMAANPSATDADFERAYSDLKADYYKSQHNQMLASIVAQNGGVI